MPRFEIQDGGTRTRRRRRSLGAALALLVLGAAGACGGGGDSAGSRSSATTRASSDATDASPGRQPDAVIDPGDGGDYRPTIDPANFVEVIDNPYLPFAPGARWVYEGVAEGKRERIEVTVTPDRKTVMGISAVVVSDINYLDGELAAKALTWYAQDRDGNVWFLGEATEDYENGELVGTEGSWEAGVDGAKPGIFMLADPRVGEAYRQHFNAGIAEALADVRRVGVAHSTGLGDYSDVVVIREWTPLEPEFVEEKYYGRGVGKIYEKQTTGGTDGTELIEYAPGH